MCILCHSDGESIDRIMLESGFSEYLLERTTEIFEVLIDMAKNVNIWSHTERL